MFWFNMDPRGRKFGHRGFRPGIFAGIIGLIFFGPAILAIVFSLVGAGAMVLYSVVSGLAQIAPRLFSGIFSSGGFAVGLAIGLVTPPVGMCLNVGSKISGMPIVDVFKASAPFLICNLCVLLLVTFIPAISLWIPSLI